MFSDWPNASIRLLVVVVNIFMTAVAERLREWKTLLVFVVCFVLQASSVTALSPKLCSPPFIFPDPQSGVTSTTLRVEARLNVLDAPSAMLATVAFTSRVFVRDDPDLHRAGSFTPENECAGHATGPTLVVTPGGTLNITIINMLDASRPQRAEYSADNASRMPVNKIYATNHWHHVNVTNLHTHGLHVDPKIDDPFRMIQPGGGVGHYSISIPQTHPTGMFWYHTHVHGASALHLMGGLFGAIFVETPESMLGLQQAQEQKEKKRPHSDSSPIIVDAANGTHQRRTPRSRLLGAFPDLTRYVLGVHLLKFARKSDPSPFPGWSFDDLDERLRSNLKSNASINVDVMAVNGQVQPVLEVVVGVPVLLHLVYASPFGELHLELPPSCTGTVVAADGIDYRLARPMPRVEAGEAQRVILVSASRFDVVMICHTAGLQRVTQRGASQFDDAVYLKRIHQLRMEPDIVFLVNVVKSKRPPAPSLANRVHHILGGEERRREMGETTLNDLRDATVATRWELSMDQSSQIAANTKLAHELPAQLVASGRAPAPVPLSMYAIGSGRNCDRTRESAASAAAGYRRMPSSDCLFRPFEGSLGDTNVSAYHGFVVRRDEVVESRWYGDPKDERPHPLHVHVNHFQIIGYDPMNTQVSNRSSPVRQSEVSQSRLERYGIRLGDWRDTIPVLPGVTTVRWRASDFSGEVVYHCHTASHEDLGMMGSYLILPPRSPRPTLSNGPTQVYEENASMRHQWTPLLLAMICVLALLWYWLRQAALRGLTPARRGSNALTIETA